MQLVVVIRVPGESGSLTYSFWDCRNYLRDHIEWAAAFVDLCGMHDIRPINQETIKDNLMTLTHPPTSPTATNA